MATSREVLDEGARRGPTYIGHEDRAKSDEENSLALPIGIHSEGVEALQHGQCKASSNIVPNVG